MDDTELLAAVREVGPATVERIAVLLGADPDAVAERLAGLESTGRVERDGNEWRVERDPRLDDSVERMQERLGRER